MTDNQEDTVQNRKISESSAEGDVEVDFKPIISLPEVEVSTNEENEEVLIKLRAKLYRFDSKTEDTPEWKERGTGEVKLLRHRENHTVRVVMRRDKTLKVCANHFITPWMDLKPSFGCTKAFVYNVLADFADEEPKTECLAIRFGTQEIANQFKEKFYEAREIVATECSLYNGTCDENYGSSDSEDEEKENIPSNEEDEEVTKKLSELDVSNKEQKESPEKIK